MADHSAFVPDPRARPAARSVRAALRHDVDRGIAMATGGAIAFAAVEYVLAVSAYPAHTAVITKLRLAALTVSLSLVLWLGLVLVTCITLALARLARAQLTPDRATAPGWFVPTALVGGLRVGVPRMWSVLIAGAAVALVVQRVGAKAIVSFKEPQLTAGVIAVASLAAVVIAIAVHRISSIALTAAAHALAPLLRFANPLGRWRAAGLALVGVLCGLLVAVWFLLPQSRSVLPTRLLVSGVAIAFGAGIAAQQHARAFDPKAASQLLATLVLVFLGAVWIFLPSRTMALPFRVAVVVASAIAGLRIGSCSTTLIRKVGGASGPLYGTAFRQAGKTLRDAGEVTLAELAAALAAGLDAVRRLGSAEEGDKTMVDAMAPAVRALTDAARAGAAPGEAFAAAAEAAREGAKATVPMPARKGRASYLGPRSVGHEDPGAASTALIFDALRGTAG